MASPDPSRGKDLARIHMAAKELGMEKDTYRDFLRSVTGKDSAGDLDRRQRWQVLQELGRLGAASGSTACHPGRPAAQGPEKDPLLRKIEAHLAEAGRAWAYADGMARHMFKVDKVQWCDADQLRRIVAALEYDARRRRTQG